MRASDIKTTSLLISAVAAVAKTISVRSRESLYFRDTSGWSMRGRLTPEAAFEVEVGCQKDISNRSHIRKERAGKHQQSYQLTGLEILGVAGVLFEALSLAFRTTNLLIAMPSRPWRPHLLSSEGA